ncbi:MAG TPA: hypothetical protein VEV41_13685 [Terriglobales bacterium]|nr:hypothetical protein [Terriglobales bacterium]
MGTLENFARKPAVKLCGCLAKSFAGFAVGGQDLKAVIDDKDGNRNAFQIFLKRYPVVGQEIIAAGQTDAMANPVVGIPV